MKNKLRLIQIILSFLLLGFLIWQIDMGDLRNRSFRWAPYLLYIPLLLAFSLGLRAYRWQVLLNSRENTEVGFLFSLRLLLVGAAINLVLPAGMGDVAKSYFGYKWTGIKESMAAVSLYDKLIAIAGIGILGFILAFLTQDYVLLIPSMVAIAPVFTLHILSSLSTVQWVSQCIEWLNARVKKIDIHELIDGFSPPFTLVLYTLFLSITAWLFTYFMMWACFQIAAEDISLLSVLKESPTLTLARLFPFTFNGMGSDEWVIVELFSTNGTTKEGIMAGALLYRMILMILPALMGIFILFSTKNKSNHA